MKYLNVNLSEDGAMKSFEEKNLLRNGEFFLILRRSIIQGMASVLREDNLISSLYGLMTTFEKPAEFHRRLHSMFGAGARIFERAILAELYQNANIPFRLRKGYRFADYVDLAARTYLGKVQIVTKSKR